MAEEDFVYVQTTDTSVVVAPQEQVVTTVVQQPSVVTTTQEQTVTTETEQTFVLAVGQQGPPGPQGDPGPAGAATLTYPAAGATSGHKAVLLDANRKVIYASNTEASHALCVLGITLGAAVQDDEVFIQRGGELQEPSWSWTVGGAIYLGADGTLIQSVPVSPALFSLILGWATAPDRMFISVGTPIFLS